VSNTEVTARVWGLPGLSAQLSAFGILCGDANPVVGLVGIDRDADLDIIRQSPELPLVALVAAERTGDNARRIVEAIELGVATVLPADAPTSRIAATLIEVAAGGEAGGGYVHPFAAEMLVAGLRARGAARARFAITRREREVLELVVDGRTTADIAACLGIGFHTAQTHMKNLFRKLDVGSRAAAASIALRHQLV
jgi:DNA-binding NarL/FixJ family response regulator